MAKDGETAILCSSPDDWYGAIAELVKSSERRAAIGRAARQDVIQRCVTAHTGRQLANLIQTKLPSGIAFVLPSTDVSGGVNVVVRHGAILQKEGHDVTLFSMAEADDPPDLSGLPVVSLRSTQILAYFDRGVATLWSTVDFVDAYAKFRLKYYLVQNYETDFYKPGDPRRISANLTYSSFSGLSYITISKWCQSWLAERFGKTSGYAPNGIDPSMFAHRVRDFS
jgi:glycosyltransferase involved in cell wall biosynthesis